MKQCTVDALSIYTVENGSIDKSTFEELIDIFESAGEEVNPANVLNSAKTAVQKFKNTIDSVVSEFEPNTYLEAGEDEDLVEKLERRLGEAEWNMRRKRLEKKRKRAEAVEAEKVERDKRVNNALERLKKVDMRIDGVKEEQDEKERLEKLRKAREHNRFIIGSVKTESERTGSDIEESIRQSRKVADEGERRKLLNGLKELVTSFKNMGKAFADKMKSKIDGDKELEKSVSGSCDRIETIAGFRLGQIEQELSKLSKP